MNPKKVAARQRKKAEQPARGPAPITSLTAQAREQLLQADILNVEAGRARLSEATKGIFGTSRHLRGAGTTMGNYMLGPGPSVTPKRTTPTRRGPTAARKTRRPAQQRPKATSAQRPRR